MHATFTRVDHRPHPPGRPHLPMLAVWNDADDPDEWFIDTEHGENTVEVPVETTAADVTGALASLGCHLTEPWQQQTTCMWIAAVTPS